MKWLARLTYPVMLVLAVLAYLEIRAWGETLRAPPRVNAEEVVLPPVAAASSTLAHLLLALFVVVVCSRACSVILRLLRQPPVVAEVVAGVMLGPSLFGHLAPGPYSFLFSPSALRHLGAVSDLGVVLFMFLVGLELDTSLLRRRSDATLVISHTSIVFPFLLGSGLSLWLYPKLSTEDVGFTPFALFMGVSMSITAFPVLARILSESGLRKSQLGTLALACAAIDDATGWCLLAAVVGFVRASQSSLLQTIALTFLYVTVMLALVKPLVARLARHLELKGKVSSDAIALSLIGLTLSALLTESIGIHALFGGFLAGAVVPSDSLLARELTDKMHDIVTILFLPAFFALAGVRTDLGLLGSLDWPVCGVILVVACAGKFGGSTLAGRFTGLSWRESASLGVLMNTRGLMELVVLNVGLELGVIGPRLFTMLVLMAILTTVATAPLLQFLNRRTGLAHGLALARPS
ncbi:MAG TPA: cation:proton antiporter [Polyangiaceae bacterium]|nr:cation:proton antiporter [Polyangiaceae bacterium]